MSTYVMSGLSATADNTATINTALANAKSGDKITVPPGTWPHSATLKMASPGVTLLGYGATFLATVPRFGGLYVTANNSTIKGLTHQVQGTTARGNGENFDDCPFSVNEASDVILQDVVSVSSRDAAYFISGGKRVLLTNIVGINSFADGLHFTDGSSDCVANGVRMINPGDDGVACVSYTSDSAIVSDIRVSNITVLNGAARGMSIVGGQNIIYTDFAIRRTNSAGIYVAIENAAWVTQAITNCQIAGGVLYDCNWGTADHGSIGVFALNKAYNISNVTIEGISVEFMRKSAPYIKIGTSNGAGGRLNSVTLQDIDLTGGKIYADGVTSTAITDGLATYASGSGSTVVSNAEGYAVTGNYLGINAGLTVTRVKI